LIASGKAGFQDVDHGRSLNFSADDLCISAALRSNALTWPDLAVLIRARKIVGGCRNATGG
jgi:hypothetical protein